MSDSLRRASGAAEPPLIWSGRPAPGDERFERVARLARQLGAAPSALIALAPAESLTVLSCQGLRAADLPRATGLCARVMASAEALVVEDVAAQTGDPDRPIRFFAGQPLRGPQGELLGVLALLDRRPRQLAGRC